MESRNKIKRERVTIMQSTAWNHPTLGSIRKLQLKDEESFLSLQIESVEEKCWDDEGGTVYKDRWVLRTTYLDNETDKEFGARMVKEAEIAKAKSDREAQLKEHEYLTYLRLKAIYDGPSI